MSRDVGGRALDNIFVERLSRSVKYENIDIEESKRVIELESGLTAYFPFYHEAPSSIPGLLDPAKVYHAGIGAGLSGVHCLSDLNKDSWPEWSTFC